VSPDEEQEQLTPVEQRLEEHLAILRGAPASPQTLTVRVIRDARWQRSLRTPMLAVAHIAAAVADTIRQLMRGSPR
jgi:hypothetical protein